MADYLAYQKPDIARIVIGGSSAAGSGIRCRYSHEPTHSVDSICRIRIAAQAGDFTTEAQGFAALCRLYILHELRYRGFAHKHQEHAELASKLDMPTIDFPNPWLKSDFAERFCINHEQMKQLAAR